jgi:hypothetical protein
MNDQPQEPSLQQIFQFCIDKVTSAQVQQQMHFLTVLESIASGADETLKTELGNAGIFNAMTQLLNGSISQNSATRTITVARIMTTAIVWMTTIAHVNNKLRGSECVVPLLNQIREYVGKMEENSTTDQDEDQQKLVEELICMSLRAIWSLLYGIKQNQESFFNNGGIPLIIRLLKICKTQFDIHYNIAGVIWHASCLRDAALALTEQGALPFMIQLCSSQDLPTERAFVLYLGLAGLSNVFDDST